MMIIRDRWNPVSSCIDAIMKNHSQHRGSQYLPVALVVLAHLSLVLWLSVSLNIWVDEAFSLHTSGSGLPHAFLQALHFEYQPPLYFLALTIWRNLGHSVFIARLFSILCSLGLLAILANIARKYFRNLNEAWLVLLIAFNPFVVWAAVEIRVYALALLLSSILVLTFLDGYVSEPIERCARRYHVVAAVLGLHTAYHLGFLLAVNALILVALKRWTAVKDYVGSMIVAACASAPLVWYLNVQLDRQGGVFANDRESLVESMLTTARHLQWFVFGSWSNPEVLWGVWNLGLKPALVVLCGVVVLRRWREVAAIQRALCLMAGLGYLVFVAARFVTGIDYAFLLRHTGILLVPTVLAAFAILALVGEGKRFVVPVIVMFVLFSYSLELKSFISRPKQGDWRNVATCIKDAEKARETIVIFPPECVLPFEVYYDGLNTVKGLPQDMDMQIYDPSGFAIPDREFVRRFLEREAFHGSVWLVTGPNLGDVYGVGLNAALLEDVVGSCFEVEWSREFFGSSVRRLRKAAINCRETAGG